MVDLNYIKQSYIVLEQIQKNLKIFYITWKLNFSIEMKTEKTDMCIWI